MQICTGGIHDKFINNSFSIKTGDTAKLTINSTPGGPGLGCSVTPPPVRDCTNDQQLHTPTLFGSPSNTLPKAASVASDDVDTYKYITTVGDLSLNEYSPSNPDYNKLLQFQTSYFYDYYSEHYNKKLSPQQNILAFKHFESTNKLNLGINVADEGQLDVSTSNLANESLNITINQNNIANDNNNIKNIIPDTDSVCKKKYKHLMDTNPQLLANSFNYALSIIPNNHNNTTIHPLSYFVDEPIINPFQGLPAGMPRASKVKDTDDHISEEGLFIHIVYV